MTALPWTARTRTRTRTDGTSHRSAELATPSGAALNTILAVREHAPAEVAELAREIQALHQRLAVAYSRKRLLEQLLAVIHQADAEKPQTSMSVIR